MWVLNKNLLDTPELSYVQTIALLAQGLNLMSLYSIKQHTYKNTCVNKIIRNKTNQ